VTEVISHLPVRQREAVLLHYFDDLNIPEVAWAMDIPQQSVSTYLELARKKLKSELDKQPAAVSMGAMAAMPIGSLIADTFHVGVDNFSPSNAGWLAGVLEQCQICIYANSAEVAIAASAVVESAGFISRVPFGALVGTVTALITTVALALGIALGGSQYTEYAGRHPEQAAVDGRIVFQGGELYGGAERINPTNVELWMEGAHGELEAIDWWITAAGSEEILYGGPGDEMDDTLYRLMESGEVGEYSLSFRVEDESGFIYRLSGVFYIKELP